MKTTYRIISVLVVSLCLLCACSSSLDEELTLNNYAPLTLSVSVGNYTHTGSGAQTRAANANAYPFTFREGDQLGIIALSKGSPVDKYNNVRFTYHEADGKWAPATALPFSPVYTYLVYYPYQTKMTDKKTKNEIIAAFPPKTDQRSEGDHRASDLLVCDPIQPAVTDKTLSVTFQHALSLLVIPPVKANITSEGAAYQCGLSFTNASITAGTTGAELGSPYVASDGTARLIVKPQTAASLTSHFKYDNKSYSSSASGVALAANHCYAFKELTTTSTYNFENAQVGDFYCKEGNGNGYLVPNYVVSFPNGMKCIGLVFKKGEDASDTGTYMDVSGTIMSTIKGYVVALQDAGAFAWANKNGDCDFRAGTSTSDTDWNGYSNCQEIKAGKEHNWAITDFPAANACITFGTAGSSSQYAAPTGSSGWFLPSCGQLRSLYDSRSLLSGQINKLKTISSYEAISWFLTTFYWSSSEYLSDSEFASSVNFYHGNMNYYYKGSSLNVRSIFAF